MSTHSSNPGAQNHFDINWPGYLWRFLGLVISLILLAVGLMRESNNLILLGIVLITVFIFLLGTSLWTLSRSGRITGEQTVEYLYRLSQTRSSDTLASIDLGLRWPGITISQHLTSGHMHVVDIYNPQLMPAKSLARTRQNAPPTFIDPRLIWYDSNLELLPLPDGGVSAVFLYHVLSELAQHGDQQVMLKEIDRVLEPGGRLLVAEMANSWSIRLSPGSAGMSLQPEEYWSRLLTKAGFEIRRYQTLHGVTVCIRADKPSPYAGKQMLLDLDYETAY